MVGEYGVGMSEELHKSITGCWRNVIVRVQYFGDAKKGLDLLIGQIL